MKPDEGRDLATIDLVNEFCSKAKGPTLSPQSAQLIVYEMNQALWSPYWQTKDVAELKKHDGNQRMRELANILRRLQSLLPTILEETHSTMACVISSEGGPSITHELLDLVNRHQHIIEAFPPANKAGRPTVPETVVAEHFSRVVFDLWAGEKRRKKAADSFASFVMEWLTQKRVPPTTNAIRKRRQRRPEKGP